MNRNLFVWDFHGVLEKDNVYAVKELTNLILKDFKVNRRINIKEARDWYGLSLFDYFKLATPEGNQQLWVEMTKKALSLQQQGWEIVRNHIKKRDFSEDVLREIRDKGHQNIVLSNSRPESIQMFTDLLDMTQYFDDIIGVDNHRTNREIHDIKTEALANFLKGREYNKVIAIGDRESDIRAGKNCGAITYFFFDVESSKRAENTNADYMISDLREVLKEV